MTNRLVAAVAALITESSLVDVNKPPMPRHEVPREVQCQGLVDVNRNKVVKLRGRMCQSAGSQSRNGLVFDLHETSPPVLRWPACAPVSAGDTSRH